MSQKKSWFESFMDWLFGKPMDAEPTQKVEPITPQQYKQQSKETPLLPTTEWLRGEIILGQYRVDRILGFGGMGAVYLLVSRDATQQKYAAKKIRFRSESLERAFLSELQTWIDLPEFPHIVACRFFRTVQGEIVIFAEYVEGGSLKDWIREGKMNNVEDIIDIAIQTAWGLHALHELGLIHQDMKSGNVLMTKDGTAKISDFGLARAKAAGGELPTISGESILVSCGGKTPAYCSPEQAEGKPVSRKTDIWSWAVTVLEMFTKRVTWSSGLAAPFVLEEYLKNSNNNPKIPDGLTNILRQCFQKNPESRPKTMLEIAEELKRVYQRIAGKEYSRPTPQFPIRSKSTVKSAIQDLKLPTKGQWDDPRYWLERAFIALGRNPKEAESLIPKREGSRKAQAVADLAAYEEARRIYEKLIESGREDLRLEFVLLLTHKAFIHEYLTDLPGSIELYDRVLEIMERLVYKEGRWELANNLAKCYMNKGKTLNLLGEFRSAVEIYNKAIEIMEKLVYKEGRWELAEDLVGCHMGKGVVIDSLGDSDAAVEIYNKAIEIMEKLVYKEGRWELAEELASCYANKGVAHVSRSEFHSAVEMYNKAIEITERLVHKKGKQELTDDLGDYYMNNGVVLNLLGEYGPAIEMFDKAINIFNRLVYKEGRWEFASNLAKCCMNKGGMLYSHGEFLSAIEMHNKAIQIFERLVYKEGRWELANDLASCYTNEGLVLSSLGKFSSAVEFCNKSIELREKLIYKDGRWEFADDLASSYMNMGIILNSLGEFRSAVEIFSKAIEIRERLLNREGRHYLANGLAKCYINKGVALNSLGEFRSAIGMFDKAIQIYERLVHKDGKNDFMSDLAIGIGLKAICFFQLGDIKNAHINAKDSIIILEKEIRKGKSNLKEFLHMLQMIFKA